MCFISKPWSSIVDRFVEPHARFTLARADVHPDASFIQVRSRTATRPFSTIYYVLRMMWSRVSKGMSLLPLAYGHDWPSRALEPIPRG